MNTTNKPVFKSGIYDYWHTNGYAVTDLLGDRWAAVCSIYRHGYCVANYRGFFETRAKALAFADKWLETRFYRHP